jgi:diaminopimelate epimerase
LIFTKLQSAGNDFVLVEASSTERDWPQLTQDICRQHFGIGADGLILMLPSKIANIGMRIFNADGSEAEACGNGLRCLVKYALSRGLINSRAKEINIETIAGLRKAKLIAGTGSVTNIKVYMGKPEFDVAKIPVTVDVDRIKQVDIKLIAKYPVSIHDRELPLSFVSMGNPHAVYFQKQRVANFPLSHIGPAVEMHKLFPNRTNFEVARVINRRLIEVRVWERGVGETLACGSGACAVAITAQLLGYVDSPVSIKLPGGILNVEWNDELELTISGSVKTVFKGEWPD